GGKTGRFVADNQPKPTYVMPGEVDSKRAGWTIHASQRNFIREAYGMPDWLLYALWDTELYHVEALD
ncbi:MAG: hypothetical protein L0Y66_16875, partial [Myxococcaceae bacterium]|nr:hypothetical protein [Myxococcaceae bacterium]MCI0674141.1 hypothetical protein [Myxococcaceae bacterium]